MRDGTGESNSMPFTVAALAAEPEAAEPTEQAPRPTPVITAEDVSGWTVEEVKSIVSAHPEMAEQVEGYERAGKARTTLLDWLAGAEAAPEDPTD